MTDEEKQRWAGIIALTICGLLGFTLGMAVALLIFTFA